MSATSRSTVALSAPQITAACVCAGVALCVLTVAGLHGFAKPGDEQPLIQGLGDRMAKIEATAQGADEAYTFPKGAVCAQSPDLAARGLQGSLAAAAQRQKLAAVTVTASAPASPGGEPQQPLAIALDANGSYPSALALLRGLADQRPMLLLDRVDLTAMGTYLHLHVSGRAYCSRTRP